MTGRRTTPGFASRPGDPDAWVRRPERLDEGKAGDAFTARLTVDITPALRGRIKVAAFHRGITVADMLRSLLDREFPDHGGAAP